MLKTKAAKKKPPRTERARKPSQRTERTWSSSRGEDLSDKPKVKEAIIVEGRDDAEVVARAVDALCITTHGFGISRETWELIDKAYKEKGIIILTDPDHAGEGIRKRIAEKYPDAKHAYVPREKAKKDGDIGIENSEPALIAEAIYRARTPGGSVTEDEAICKARSLGGGGEAVPTREADEGSREPVDMGLLQTLGLVAESGSSELRRKVAEKLGIAYGNNKAFLRMLNGFGISADELKEAVAAVCEARER